MANEQKSLVPPLKASHTNVRAKTKGKTQPKPATHPFALATGTPNQMKDQIQVWIWDKVTETNIAQVPEDRAARLFKTEAQAKKAAIEFFREFQAWARRYNSVGLVAIDYAVTRVSSASIGEDPVIVTCLLDEHTNFIQQVKIWKAA